MHMTPMRLNATCTSLCLLERNTTQCHKAVPAIQNMFVATLTVISAHSSFTRDNTCRGAGKPSHEWVPVLGAFYGNDGLNTYWSPSETVPEKLRRNSKIIASQGGGVWY